MQLIDKELEALFELEKIANLHRSVASKSWAVAIKARPELHEILGHANPRVLALLYKKHFDITNGLCSKCGLGQSFKSGLCEIHYEEHIEEMAELRSQIKIRIDDSYEVRVANPSLVVIINYINGKQLRFKTNTSLPLKDRIRQICRQLMMINKMRQPRFKLMFETPIEAMKFVEKLKKKVKDMED